MVFTNPIPDFFKMYFVHYNKLLSLLFIKMYFSHNIYADNFLVSSFNVIEIHFCLTL
jgi:hypothetical protein